MQEAIDLLRNLDTAGFITMFWYYWLFEVPRYVLSSLAVGWQNAFPRPLTLPDPDRPISVLLVGHNEGDKLTRAVRGLREQTHRRLQIVVIDDGSTDGMAAVGSRLQAEGRVDRFISTGIRGGKAAALNLGLSFCRHDITVVMDIDTSLDRDAIARVTAPLMDDAEAGAVSGNLAVRNPDQSLLTALQHIEYITNISIGRQFTSMFGILMIVSGAFGAFRTDAIRQVGGWDVGPGDDSNLTTKLRAAGWGIRFEPSAWAMTDVPATFNAFVKQRTRWSRSLIRNRLRKFSMFFNPFHANFSVSNLIGSLVQLWFDLGLAIAFLIYFTTLVIQLGGGIATIIIAVTIIELIGAFLEMLVASVFLPRLKVWPYLPYLVGHGFYVSFLNRAIRLRAYFLELAFRDSYNDPFYPTKVRKAQDQF